MAAMLNDPAVLGMELPQWVNWILTGGMLLVLLSPWGVLWVGGALSRRPSGGNGKSRAAAAAGPDCS